jgi:hypothetical protein
MPTAYAAPGSRRIDKWDCGCLSWEAVCEMSGGALTYRMLNYWTANLGIVPAIRHAGPGGDHVTDDVSGHRYGSGTVMGWTPGHARRAAIAAVVISRTGMRPEAALSLVDGVDVVTTLDGTDIIIAVHVIPPRTPATPATVPASPPATDPDPPHPDAD